MRTIRAFGVLCILAIPLAGEPPAARAAAGDAPAPRMFEGLGSHHRVVTTGSPEAQRWFDQGLTWMYAFNHDEAIRSFQEATRIDPLCVMAWWGIAICNGPHINLPVMDEERDARAWEALGRAMALREGAKPTERDLIEALSHRYANPAPKDRASLDRAYADAMRGVWKQHQDDADVATLFAESVMDLHPWDLWTVDGKPKEGAEEVVAALEAAMRLNAKHPGANHLYIHAVEASAHPERGNASAEFLRTAVPGAGHLVHMPAHIDIRTGRWTQAVDANKQAIEADKKYRTLSPRQGFYNVYMAHNPQFLCFVSMMQGNSAEALASARQMVAAVPPEYAAKESKMVDPVVNLPLAAMMRFGMWEEILAAPEPPEIFPIAIAMRRFTRGVALAALGRLDDAGRERIAFQEAAARVPEDAMMAVNHAHQVLAIAEHVLQGEIAYRDGRIDEAVVQLREGARLEDQLTYMEPPEWIQPVRHTLGAVLVDAGRFKEAEAEYREDLRRWPENGWSLYGLTRCLEGRGATAEAKEARARFEKAWARADISLNSTCLCVTGSTAKAPK